MYLSPSILVVPYGEDDDSDRAMFRTPDSRLFWCADRVNTWKNVIVDTYKVTGVNLPTKVLDPSVHAESDPIPYLVCVPCAKYFLIHNNHVAPRPQLHFFSLRALAGHWLSGDCNPRGLDHSPYLKWPGGYDLFCSAVERAVTLTESVLCEAVDPPSLAAVLIAQHRRRDQGGQCGAMDRALALSCYELGDHALIYASKTSPDCLRAYEHLKTKDGGNEYSRAVGKLCPLGPNKLLVVPRGGASLLERAGVKSLVDKSNVVSLSTLEENGLNLPDMDLGPLRRSAVALLKQVCRGLQDLERGVELDFIDERAIVRADPAGDCILLYMHPFFQPVAVVQPPDSF